VTPHVDEGRLDEHALGLLDPVEQAEVEAHLALCADCRRRLSLAHDVLLGVAAGLPSSLPSPEARLRLMQAVRPVQPIQHLAFAERLARFLDVPVASARSVLEKASNPTAWVPAPFPGLHLMHIAAGPSFAGADAGLVKFAGNVPFPLHSHDGDEHTFMLAGGITFQDGRTLQPGDQEVLNKGDQHGFMVAPEGCLYAQILYVGIDIAGLGKVSLRR
jgi:putative transcriptional regulator